MLTFAQAIAELEDNIEKRLIHFWKDYNICGYIKNLAWVCGDATKECMNGIWKKTFKSYIHDFKKFAKDKEVVKINKCVVEILTTLTWVWIRMTLRNSRDGFLEID